MAEEEEKETQAISQGEKTHEQEHFKQKIEVLTLIEEDSSQKASERPTSQKRESSEEIVANVLTS